jgi:hypothetical protein
MSLLPSIIYWYGSIQCNKYYTWHRCHTCVLQSGRHSTTPIFATDGNSYVNKWQQNCQTPWKKNMVCWVHHMSKCTTYFEKDANSFVDSSAISFNACKVQRSARTDPSDSGRPGCGTLMPPDSSRTSGRAQSALLILNHWIPALKARSMLDANHSGRRDEALSLLHFWHALVMLAFPAAQIQTAWPQRNVASGTVKGDKKKKSAKITKQTTKKSKRRRRSRYGCNGW